MPLKLSVGVSRKVGQPAFGSIGAACGVELELESGLLRDAPDDFHARVQSVYAACARAVDAGLSRFAAPPTPTITRAGHAEANRAPGPPVRPATPRQLRALGAIARSRGIEADELLEEHGLDSGSVSSAAASRLISGLRAAAAG